MAKPKKPPSGRTNCASCIVATVFLLFIITIALIVYFTVFKPKPVTLTVTGVRLPTFSAANATVAFTFEQYVTAANPNRAEFAHYDSSLHLLYGGAQVGFMFIPAGKVSAGGSQYMTAAFAVQAFSISGGGGGGGSGPMSLDGPTVTDGLSGVRVGSTMEIVSRLEMAGRVRVLNFLSHHLDARVHCRVAVSVSDGSVLGFRCR